MIEVKMFNGKWRILVHEEWQFKEYKEFMDCLGELIEYKNKFGRWRGDKDGRV